MFKPFLPKETLLDTIILLVSTSYIKIAFFGGGESYVFQFQYHQTLYFYPFLYKF